MASVSGDDAILWFDTSFEADGYSFLQTRSKDIHFLNIWKEIRTWPIAKWQNPRISLALYKASAAISIRRIVCICLYIDNSWSFVTWTWRFGISQLYVRKESWWSCTVNGWEESVGGGWWSWVVSAEVWIARESLGWHNLRSGIRGKADIWKGDGEWSGSGWTRSWCWGDSISWVSNLGKSGEVGASDFTRPSIRAAGANDGRVQVLEHPIILRLYSVQSYFLLRFLMPCLSYQMDNT